MNRATTLLAITALLTSLTTQAQQKCLPDSLIDYLDVDYVKVPAGNKGAYTRVRHYTSPEGGTWDLYYPSGQQRSVVTYANFRKARIQGLVQDYYPSGLTKLRYVADDGLIDGYLLTYYPNGTLKRKDLYDHGRLIKGQYLGPDGQLIEPHVPLKQDPAFPGGNEALIAAINQRVVYPPDAGRDAAEGRVLVHFIVTARGDVTQVRVPQPGNALLDAAAVAAVRQLPAFEPGRVDGERVPIDMTVPITFKASATLKTLRRLGL
ncbi:hypothetical protein GCM10022408_23160 [Hymenobacter fastidiosus]|uniref:TonB C-terminal domain-containing protein n=1 Tax=Hymenobacter fastidiosus TaxID=486264 RepID=A0ABP7SDP1_9BACT